MPEESRLLDIEALESAIEERNVGVFQATAEDLHYADLASVFQDLDDDEARSFFTQNISLESFPQVLAELPDAIIEETLERFDENAQREILRKLIDDDRADVVIHFVRRDHHAGPCLFNLAPDRRIQCHEENLESIHFHSHSSSSQRVAGV